MVLDSSLLLSVMLVETDASRATEVVRRARQIGARAPALLPFEMVSVLGVKLRRGVITPVERDALLRDLPLYGVVVEPPPPTEVLLTAARLAQQYGLTGYDASYLELAMRLGAELGTFDEALAAAARACGLEVLGR